MYRFDIQQNTPEWLQAKLGKFSASTAADLLMASDKEGYKKLINKILEERITGQESDTKWSGNQYTQRGHEFEPIAIEDFEKRFFRKINRVGIIEQSEWICCSPDGLIGEDTLIQIKCPIFATQLEYLETQKIPTNYYKQMQFELYVAGRNTNIFYSYHPFLPAVKIEMQRDEEVIMQIRNKLNYAISEVELKIDRYSKWK